MSIFVFIQILLYLKGFTAQECHYDINRFTEIICSGMTSVEQLNDAINATLHKYHSGTIVIESLELTACKFADIAIESLLFLNQLQELKISDSNIRKLSSEDATTSIIERKGKCFDICRYFSKY